MDTRYLERLQETVVGTSLTLLFVAVILCSGALTTFAQEVDDCYICHDDESLTTTRNGKEVSLHVNPDRFSMSVHSDFTCVDCHFDLIDTDFPHAEEVEDVSCADCHDDIAEIYDGSLHGQQVQAGEELAPQCWDCHSMHEILPPSNPESQVAKFNIPLMCATCHKEGTPVTQKYDLPVDSVFKNYSQSIHGHGLYQQGLTVTAVCTDCHTAHNVRPLDDPQSSINRDNVANTCRACHGRIETVHRKVIRGELWEKEPDKVPACVDCHRPHEIRASFYDEGIANEECLRCHSQRDLTMDRDGETISLFVDTTDVRHSAHRTVTCAQCHTGATPSLHTRPCATVANTVDCSICHDQTVIEYSQGVHGKLADRGDPDAPRCVDCHGTHAIKMHNNPESPTFPTNVPDLCAKCHGEDGKATARYADGNRNVVDEYKHGTHGIGLLSSGLVVTAMCTDCHTAHKELPPDDPESSVHTTNIPKTCAKCHNGIYEQFSKSIHSTEVSDMAAEKLPTCADCHQSHNIEESQMAGFRMEIWQQCGECHEDVTESYFETVHGKLSKLESEAAATCYDCHGAHDILPTDDPESSLSFVNIVETCGQCHEGSHQQFAGYLTHATHHDRDKYPILYYTFWFMTTLLIVTFTFFGIHTILWLPRAFQAKRALKKMKKTPAGTLVYQRFKPLHRRLHIMMVISFLGLAITGMSLKFSYLGWAQIIMDLLGGAESAGFIHRICAVITFLYFGIHVFDLIREKIKNKESWKSLLFKGDSMIPTTNDIKELFGTFRWFIGLGPRPQYGKWTYWEKFDYFAVFWGVAVIGLTGLILWFPELFTRFLPGWMINVAMIIHSDEALLAVGFIFTVHFFNTHFRPDKFPMDDVIFTGRMSVDELRHDRPKEYQDLMATKEIKKHLVDPLPPYVVKGLRIFGFTALLIGLTLIILIIYAVTLGYK